MEDGRSCDIYQLHAIPYPWAMSMVMETLAQLQAGRKYRSLGLPALTPDERARALSSAETIGTQDWVR